MKTDHLVPVRILKEKNNIIFETRKKSAIAIGLPVAQYVSQNRFSAVRKEASPRMAFENKQKVSMTPDSGFPFSVTELGFKGRRNRRLGSKNCRH